MRNVNGYVFTSLPVGTLRPSVPTGWVATWLMAKCRFIGIYGTKIEKSY